MQAGKSRLWHLKELPSRKNDVFITRKNVLLSTKFHTIDNFFLESLDLFCLVDNI